MIILSLVVLILFMGMASASSDLDDHNDTLTVSGEIEIVDDNSENLDNGNAEMLGASSQGNDVLGNDVTYDGTTWSGLISKMNSATVGDTIILQNDITADTSGTSSHKAIIIDGNGHTIDANGKKKLFDSTSRANIVFKNIIFKNSPKGDDEGGILRFWYGPLEFINCTFQNCGPLSLSRVTDCKIINCTFDDCKGSYSGAIYGQKDYTNNFNITGCTFKNCNGGSGSVIYRVWKNIVVDNCTFEQNTGGSGGGVIWIDSGDEYATNASITNCIFRNNTSPGFGIVEIYTGIVDNCTFIGNNLTANVGVNNGGILRVYGTGNVTNCTFKNNAVPVTASTSDPKGMICLDGSDIHYVINCTFENNTGSEIFNYAGTAYVYNNTFNSTNAYVYNAYDMYLENNTVKNYIYNNGMIKSKTYLTAMNNQTIIGTKGYSMTLNGTVTDDMGNVITMGYNVIGFSGVAKCQYTFTMTDKSGRQVYTYTVSQGNYESDYDSDTGVFYTQPYTFNEEGVFTVTPSFKNYNAYRGFDNTSVRTGVILIQAALTMDVTHNDTIYVGENATVRVTLSDDSARGNITITVGDQNKTFVLSDDVYGTVEWNISGLPEGTYPVIVNYTGDDSYTAQNYEGTLVVKNYDTVLLITPEHGTYHQVVNATATLYYAKGSTIVGMIDDDLTVIINNKQYNVRSGEKIQVTDDLAVNAYEVVGIYTGSDRYKSAYNNTNLYVTKATPLVEIEVLTEPSEERLGVRVRVNDTATGFVALKINDEVIDILSLKSVDEYGYLTKFIDVNAGNFNIEAEYLGDENYTNASNKTSFSNIRGTYTDLQRLINENTNLDLTYDFIYTPAIDGDNFPNGVNITKTITINGNNHTISGNNTLAVFNVNGTGVHLNNITFINAKADNTVFWNNTLGYISNSTFKDNDVTYDIYNNQTMSFENNNLENFIYNAGEILSKTNIIVLNNQTITVMKGANVNLNAIIKDDNNNTIVSKTKLQFILLTKT